MVNLLLVSRQEVMAANWKETIIQRRAEKSGLGISIKFRLDILIAHVLNY